jgi:hypothetical protein
MMLKHHPLGMLSVKGFAESIYLEVSLPSDKHQCNLQVAYPDYLKAVIMNRLER